MKVRLDLFTWLEVPDVKTVVDFAMESKELSRALKQTQAAVSKYAISRTGINFAKLVGKPGSGRAVSITKKDLSCRAGSL